MTVPARLALIGASILVGAAIASTLPLPAEIFGRTDDIARVHRDARRSVQIEGCDCRSPQDATARTA